MRFGNKAIAAAGAGFALAAIVGCGGSSGLLSANQANQLSSQLQQASQALSNGQCQAARTALQTAANYVENSLGSVDQRLVSNLQQGVSTTQTLARRECPVHTQTQTQTQTSTTTTTATTTSTTTTAPTTTTNTTTQPTTTTATTTTTTTSSTPSTSSTTTPPPSGGTGLPSSGHLVPGRGRKVGFWRGRGHHQWWWYR